LDRLKTIIIDYILGTQNVGKTDAAALMSRFKKENPLKVRLDGRPNFENQDYVRRSHMIDVMMQLVAFPQMLGLTLDELAHTSELKPVRSLVMLCYRLLKSCLDSPMVKAYICLGKGSSSLCVNKTHGSKEKYLQAIADSTPNEWIASLKMDSCDKDGVDLRTKVRGTRGEGRSIQYLSTLTSRAHAVV
jgi:hypothetical protein